LGAAAVRAARGSPCVERLVERHSPTCHRIAIHIEEAQRDHGRSGGSGQTLGSPRHRLNGGKLRAGAKSLERHALACPIEASSGGSLLSLTERPDGEGPACDSVCARGDRCVACGGDPGGGLPGHGLACCRCAVAKHQNLRGPRDGGARGQGESRRQGSEDRRCAAVEMRLQARAIGERSYDHGCGSVDRGDGHGSAAVSRCGHRTRILSAA
jgi:hypothetical protein